MSHYIEFYRGYWYQTFVFLNVIKMEIIAFPTTDRQMLLKKSWESYWICERRPRDSLFELATYRKRGKENDINFGSCFPFFFFCHIVYKKPFFLCLWWKSRASSSAAIETQSSWYSKVSLRVDGCHRFFPYHTQKAARVDISLSSIFFAIISLLAHYPATATLLPPPRSSMAWHGMDGRT